MIDWFVLLGALALLPAIALLYFVGCGHIIGPGPDDDPSPPQSAGGTGTTPTQPVPIVSPTPPPPPPPPPPRTLLELTLDDDINKIQPLGPNDAVDSVLITWTLKTRSPAPPAVDLPLDETMVPVDETRDFLDPTLDPAATFVLTDDEAKRYGSVVWKATVSTKAVVGLIPRAPSPTTGYTIDIVPGFLYSFRLKAVWTSPQANPRQFELVAEQTTSAPPAATLPTRLQLNLASKINEIVAGGREFKAEAVLVTWTLKQTTGVRPDQTLHQTIVRTDPSRRFLDPLLDQSAIWDLSADQVANYDQVTCLCKVTCAPVTGTAPRETSESNGGAPYPVNFAKNKVNVLVLSPDWSDPAAVPRVFTVAV